MRIAGRRAQGLFSQVTYCGGYSGEVPPLPIPNREVKLTHADGTDPPVGRVGSRRSSEALSSARLAGLLCLLCRTAAALVRCCAAARFPLRSHPPTFSPLRFGASGEGPGLRRNSPGTLSLRFTPLRGCFSRFSCCFSAPSPLRSDAPAFSRQSPSRFALLVSVEPFPLRSDASEQGSSLREIRSEPCPSALLRCAVDLPVSVVFPPARIKLFWGRRLLA